MTTHHSQRIDLMHYGSAAQAAMLKFDALARDGLDPTIAELVKIRVSQINGCNFCAVMHIKEAKAHGELQERIDSIATWRESSLFDQRERAALELAENITNINDGKGVSDAIWAEAAQHFGSEELTHLILVSVAINSWNRMAVTVRMQSL